MYLTAKIYLPLESEELQKKCKAVMNSEYEVGYVELRVGYWRKSNQIHKWFVDNIQKGVDDCGDYYVSEDDLKKLLTICNEALESKSPEIILPTTSGFFFGSTEYDEYYRQDLEETKQIIEKWLAFHNKDRYDLFYHSSW